VRGLLGLPLAVLSRLRRVAYDRGLFPVDRLHGPVISVGNLAVGGRGKTPVVARICAIVREEGQAVAVLSRGYRGAFRGDCLLVSDGRRVTAGFVEAGDEPVMLARQLPGVIVGVGRRRARVGRALEERFGPLVHVLDDGFQHLPLHRDLDLVCLEARDLVGTTLPAGRLREPLSALVRADLVLVAALDREWPSLADRVGRDRVLRLGRKVLGFASREGGPAQAPRRPFLLAAIAEPERFQKDAKVHAEEIVGTAFFRDHHVFTPPELEAVSRQARECSADAIVTTEKDEVRLPAPLDLGLPLLVLRIAAAIENEALLRERIRAVLRRAA
jgi:tetraacyldisaccharide 4'-kinase